MTVLYDPGETIVRTLTHYEGTVLPLVLRKPLFWVIVAINTCFIVAQHVLMTYYGVALPTIDWDVVGLPASLLVFFLVLYAPSVSRAADSRLIPSPRTHRPTDRDPPPAATATRATSASTSSGASSPSSPRSSSHGA